MKEQKIFTAVGRFYRKRDMNGYTYPVVSVNGKEHILDPQEMTVWAILCWRMLTFGQIEEKYDRLMAQQSAPRRSLEFCIERLQTSGLIASGFGNADNEALYDLLSELYVVPISENPPLRWITFVKLVLFRKVPVERASVLLHRDERTDTEKRVISLSKQALLSTAEIIKCFETETMDVSDDEKLIDALYAEPDTSSDNMADMMRGAAHRLPVTSAIANLYLRRQIILERV